MNFDPLDAVSDDELRARVKRLMSFEARCTAQLIHHLVEIENRQLHLADGCSDLFYYCTQILHFTEDEAYNRVEAVKAARRFPIILEMLANGSLRLTTVRRLGKHLTTENHREVLVAAIHKTQEEVGRIIARLAPKPDIPDSARKVRKKSAAGASTAGAQLFDSKAESSEAPSNKSASQTSHEEPKRRDTSAPLSSDRYQVTFTASAATYEMLQRAKALLRHQIPGGAYDAIVQRALVLLLKDLEKTKFAATEKPRPARDAAGDSRNIPASVKRDVWLRDGEQCVFVGENGHRCTERGFLEYDHEHPYADGGKATVQNVRILCRGHNQFLAKQYLGVWRADRLGESASWYGDAMLEASSEFHCRTQG